MFGASDRKHRRKGGLQAMTHELCPWDPPPGRPRSVHLVCCCRRSFLAGGVVLALDADMEERTKCRRS